MARLDELLEQVGNPVVRRELERIYAEMRRRQQFGLVFEEHLPEMTALLAADKK